MGYDQRAWDNDLDLEVFTKEWEELPHALREAAELLGMEDYFASPPRASPPEHTIDRLHEIMSHSKAGLIIAVVILIMIALVLLTFRAYLMRVRKVHADKSRKAV